MMRRIACKEFRKIYQVDGVKHRLIVVADLYQLVDSQDPYFSITGSVEYQAKNNRWCLVCCGAIHEQILEQLPDLAHLVAIHLSNENGQPMHAFANAGYWAGSSKYQELDLVTLAKHLRVTENTALEMVNYVKHFWGELDSVTTPENAWRDACDHFGLFDQWREQAATAKNSLNLTTLTGGA